MKASSRFVKMKGTEDTLHLSGNTILCPIDFSEPSLDALRWAAQLARQQQLHVTIIYPYRLNVLNRKEDLVQMKKNIDQDAARNFEKIAKGLLEDAHVTYDFRSEVGFMNDRVQEHVRKGNLSMVVLSKKMALGSKDNLQELIDHADVPLVIIPTHVN